MRIAVISDIHANHEALQAVYEDLDRVGVDSVFCLGDLIGYGPEPDTVVLSIRDRGIDTVQGNHELAVITPSHLLWFNPPARESLKWSAGKLSEAARTFIAGLPPSLVAYNCRFVHGFPPESVTNYAFAVSNNEIRKAFSEMAETICFVGHTHLLEIIAFDGRGLHRSRLTQTITRLPADRRHIVNIGSIGQPRDGNHDAKYVIYDIDQKTVELRHVAYDIASVVKKIRAAGLPESHALRLL